MRWMTRGLRVVLLLVLAAAGHAGAKDWVVGQIGPFTVLPVPDAIQLGEGMSAFFTAANERGGINGAHIEFFQLDDAYNADKFVERFREAMARQPVALLSPLGSASVKRMLDMRLLDTSDVVVLNAIPGAEALRNPGHPKLFHLRAGDRQQIEKIVRHVHTLGIQRLGVVHQDIPMGQSGVSVASEAVRDAGALQMIPVMSSGTEAALGHAADVLVKADAQSVLVIGSPKFSVDAMAALQKRGLRNSMFALSYLVPSDLARALGPSARGVGISQAMPNPMGVVLPVQREFQAAMRRRYPALQQYSVFHLEGFLCAKLFYEVARRLKEPSASAFAATLHRMGDIDLGGYHLDFSRGNVGSTFVDIAVADERGKLVY